MAVIRSARIPVFWGIAGFAVALIIAAQLAWPALNFDLLWTTFGRLRPHAAQRPEIKAARRHPHCCFCFRG